MSLSISPRKIVGATPTLDTNAYAAGDHMGTLITLTGLLGDFNQGLLESLAVVDKGKQSKGFTVLLFSSEPTLVSVDNAALDISDADVASKCLGAFSVAAADYDALNASSVATIKNIGIELTGTDGAVYAMLMADEAQTHAAADLVLKFGVRIG